MKTNKTDSEIIARVCSLRTLTNEEVDAVAGMAVRVDSLEKSLEWALDHLHPLAIPSREAAMARGILVDK